MQQCLDLAIKASGKTLTNPMVGCVIVHQQKIIGEGFHTEYGKPHAEAEAINSVAEKSLLKNSVLYVNLEPCNHYGKTPPCADLIINSQIPEVVICNSDPNPLVAGNGIKKLQEHGIKVTVGILKEKGEFLNRRFFTFHRKKRPYIILKWAQTNDGFIDKIRNTVKSQIYPISGEKAHQLVHQWRAEETGILVGKNTVINDNPNLTVRLAEGKNPVRIVLDRNLELKKEYSVFNTEAKTIIVNSIKNEVSENHHYLKPEDDFSLKSILKSLYATNIQSILAEGGAFTLNQFIKSGLWDECRIFTSPENWHEGLKAPEFNFIPSEEIKIGNDSLKIYYNV